MKAFSIQQPWGSLICAGIKDVENRKWALKSTPLTVLIHVGAKRHKIDEDTMPLVWANPIEDAQTMGLIGRIKDMPTSAIIGVATIDRCEEENFSIWAQDGPGAEYKWVMRDVKLFKEPIQNVKGKLGIFDIPEITSDNLPECMEIPSMQREGKHLTIPVARDLFNLIQDGECDILNFNLNNINLPIFATKTLNPKPTESVTLVCDGEQIDANVVRYAIVPVLNDNNDVITYTDAFDRDYKWYRVEIQIE
ncbi:MAG: ASCH domain-containing protein [Bacteroides sp.]|nr:ASCH domain-containing protein [Bacteroides sp.]